VGVKESYLLLLPITPQSPALSTCKMTLDMPVLMVSYGLRLLCDEARGSSGGGGGAGGGPHTHTHTHSPPRPLAVITAN